jgi:hypothetical protein
MTPLMTEADSSAQLPRASWRSAWHVSPGERRLMVRLTLLVLFGLILLAAFDRLDLVYSHKFFDVTGKAQWIWADTELSRELPVAFFATRDFDLPPNRAFTRIKVLGDPEYTLFFNGRELGGRRVGDEAALDVYDVSELARTGRNRMVVAVRSPNGVGGLIASVDITEELLGWVTTDRSWKIVSAWRPDLLLRDPPDAARPMLFGGPPTGRWNYLQTAVAVLAVPPSRVIAPRSVTETITYVPQIKIASGVAIATKRRTRARVFDFGPTFGRLRVTRAYITPFTHTIGVRFANAPEELSIVEADVLPVVFAGNERTVVDPEVHHFRYVVLYGERASVEVLQ